MSELKGNNETRRPWIAPEIRELEVSDTSAIRGPGADVGGNPLPDSQRS